MVTRLTVHPHACGDDVRIGAGHHATPGSPPRVWGRLAHWPRQLHAHRFTPTRVGTTSCSVIHGSRATVHPHACGDDQRVLALVRPGDGSPPRVWGRPAPAGSSLNPVRFTPTRVGTTGPRGFEPQSSSVHPHACGDDPNVSGNEFIRSGSPPRVWGRLGLLGTGQGRYRFTPTRVGTTPTRGASGRGCPVHPHACGDDYQPDTPARLLPRFTPTRVGTTQNLYLRPGW